MCFNLQRSIKTSMSMFFFFSGFDSLFTFSSSLPFHFCSFSLDSSTSDSLLLVSVTFGLLESLLT